MKRVMMILIASLVFCGSIFAQHDDASFRSHWADFDGGLYFDQDPTVAFVQIDDKFITASDNWAGLEIASFVGDECRGHTFLVNLTEEYGDPYPVIELSIYFTNEGEEVSFKMYDHAKGIEYNICSVNVAGKPLTIKTGEDHTEEYSSPDSSVILSFYSSRD